MNNAVLHVKRHWPISAVVRMHCQSVQEATQNSEMHEEPHIRPRSLFGRRLSWVQTASTQSSDSGVASNKLRGNMRTDVDLSQGESDDSLECVNVTVQCNKVERNLGVV